MNNSDTKALSFQDWARRVRRRVVRDLLRTAAAQARALAKRSRRPRRGRAATDLGLIEQQLTADRKRIMALVGELTRLTTEHSDTGGSASPRRRRAASKSRRAAATRPHLDAT